MKKAKTIIILLSIVVSIVMVECTFHNRRIFVSKFAGNKKSSLSQIKVIRKQIHDDALQSLYSLEPEIKKDLLHQAEKAYNGSYPVKTAWEYMEYFRDGNRAHYESKIHNHRERMALLLLGHLLDREHNQTSTRYIDEIVNGIWMVMEESTWSYPAHLYLEKTGQHLTVPKHYSVDLNAGEMAKFLGWTKLLLADKFDQVTAVINQRIDYELHRRIFQAYMNRSDYFWEGFTGAHDVNNWNIWVNGNILKSALFTLDNEQLFNAVLNRTLYSADYFLDNYGEDGGCDEGPAYWRQAGGRLIEYIELLVQIHGTAAKEYLKSVQLFKRIGEYSYKMLITKNWFVNFADSVPPISYPPALLAQYGILFDDENMKRFAGYMLQYDTHSKNHQLPPDYHDESGADLNEFFNYIMLRKQMNSFNTTAPVQQLVWLPDIQVVNARSTQIFIAAKAGTNHESHNHNDVGNFILYQNGTPVLIDIGVGTYTAQTFGANRYDLFYMQSQYHNCPTINGVAQHDGSKYTAKNVSLKQFPDEKGFLFTADISGAYPNSTYVSHWIRSIQFNKTSNVVTLDDEYELEKFLKPQELHFIVTEKVKHQKNEQGLWLYSADKKTVSIQMNFDWSVFQLDELTKSLDNDKHLTRVWGANVRRLTLKTVPSYNELKGKFVIQFMPK